MSRSSYHTSLKELVYHGLIPEQYVKTIPKSNLHRWKNDDVSRYVGSEINQIADKHLDKIQLLNQYSKMFYAYANLIETMVGIATKTKDFYHIMKESKTEVVNAISKVKGILSIEKAAKVFNISKGTFHSWVIDTKLKCQKSTFNQCLRVYSGQITPMEVKQIKSALLHPKRLHWSMKSIHLHGIRNKSLTVSINTLYKINRLFEIRKTRGKIIKKKKQRKGIRATESNRIWHTDITIMKTLDNKKYYIYLLIDNFSRKIISYEVKERVSGLITAGLIEDAYDKTLAISDNLNIDLIVDGGPENCNIHVDRFISQSKIKIDKLIALKDINYSNSMVERVNRTLKYRYIFPKEPRDLKQLKRIVRYFIEDYNNRKPHGELQGLTPHEAWSGMKIDKSHHIQVLTQARADRKVYNKENKCKLC